MDAAISYPLSEQGYWCLFCLSGNKIVFVMNEGVYGYGLCEQCAHDIVLDRIGSKYSLRGRIALAYLQYRDDKERKTWGSNDDMEQ